MRPALIALYSPNYSPPPTFTLPQLLAPPLPPPDIHISELTLTLLATFLLHSVTALSRRTDDLAEILSLLRDPSTPSLFAWAPIFAALPAKHHDALFTRTYTVMAKAASHPGVPMQHAFALRMYALGCLARTRPGVVAPDTFWDQAVKWARFHAAEPLAGDESRIQDILQSVQRLVQSLREREDYASFLEDPGFARFCEVWVFWAQQVGHSVLANHQALNASHS